MKKFFIIFLFIYFNNTFSALSQCGNITDCPAGINYPYQFCKNPPDPNQGVAQVICTDDPFNLIGNGYNALKIDIPICINPNEITNPIPNRVDINVQSGTVEVFDRTAAINEMNQACYDWNCLCGKQNDQCQCQISCSFSTNASEFGSSGSEALAQSKSIYWAYYCTVQCGQSFIAVNNSNDFCDNVGGYPTRYFITEDNINLQTMAQIKQANCEVYDFLQIMLHEIGHVLGFDHYDDCTPSIHGIMDAKQDMATGTFAGLNIYDKCMFKKLYCPDLVPVKEQYAQNNDDELNGYNYAIKRFEVNYELPDNIKIINIGIYNYLGQFVMNLNAQDIMNVNHKLILNCSDLTYGFYYLYIETDKNILFCKLLLNQ